jgi:hypothetical protein
MSRFTQAKGVHARRFDDELVLLDLQAGTYFGLDEIGARIWEGLIAGRAPDEIAKELVETYDTDLQTLHADVESLAASLVQHGLLIERSAP